MTRPARVQRHRQAAVVGIRALLVAKDVAVTERHAGGLAPSVLPVVSLDHGVRLLGSLVDDAGRVCQTDGSAEVVRTGRRVRVRFHEQTGVPLLQWALAD